MVKVTFIVTEQKTVIVNIFAKYLGRDIRKWVTERKEICVVSLRHYLMTSLIYPRG